MIAIWSSAWRARSFRLRRDRMPLVDLVLSPTREVVRGDRLRLRQDLDALFDRVMAISLTPSDPAAPAGVRTEISR